MRTTVGPLPSAVYWRRRAVVLGAVLLGIIVLFVAWPSGKDDKKTNGTGKPASTVTSYPTPGPGSSSDDPDDNPSFTTVPPGGAGPSLPNPADLTSSAADPGQPTVPVTQPTQNGANTNVTVPAGNACADSEMSVTPQLSATTVKRGVQVMIRTVIKNTSNRTCTRDVGAGPQELYLDQGPTVYWSSDTCSTDKSSDVRTFGPGQQISFANSWNGREATGCTTTTPRLANGPNPPAGVFAMRARLGTLLSNPVQLTITN